MTWRGSLYVLLQSTLKLRQSEREREGWKTLCYCCPSGCYSLRLDDDDDDADVGLARHGLELHISSARQATTDGV